MRFMIRFLVVGTITLGIRVSVPAELPQTQPVVPHPATRPGATELRQRAQATLAKLEAKYGKGLLYEIDDDLKLVFATDLNRAMLLEMRAMMTAHAQGLQADLFRHGLTEYLAVIIPRQWRNDRVTGHFYGDRVDARTIGASLKHEFTHALHHADQQGRGQEHPVWIMEGLASLFESARAVDGHLVPRSGRSVVDLQAQIRSKATVPLKKFAAFPHRQFTSRHYAQACYVFLYLHAHGQLRAWYDAYTATYAQDPTGLAALEKVLSKPIDQIERDWVEWVLGLPAPGPIKSSLGLRLRQLPDALQVEEVVADGAAAQAKLAVGDALIALDGQRLIDPDDLAEILRQRGSGESVRLRYRRDGQMVETTITLEAAPPQAAAPSKPATRPSK